MTSVEERNSRGFFGEKIMSLFFTPTIINKEVQENNNEFSRAVVNEVDHQSQPAKFSVIFHFARKIAMQQNTKKGAHKR